MASISSSSVRRITRFDTVFEPRADWPLAEESQGSRSVVSDARLRRADPEMLRTAFRRCHNFIHGNEGMPKDAAFWQFLYLIFAKMHDERGEGVTRRFYAQPTEPFTTEGRKAIRARIEPLFEEVKQKYGPAPTIQFSVATKRSRSQTVPSGSSSPSWHATTLRAPILMPKALPTRSS